MALIRMDTQAARAIRDKLNSLNHKQHDLFTQLYNIITYINNAWNGEIASAAAERLERTKTDSGAITEMMNKYGDALDFAIQELEEADWKLSLNNKVAGVEKYPYGENYNIKGECVWYVRNRAKEKGFDTYDISGNGNQWWNNAIGKNAPTGSEIRSDSIACFSGPYSAGHVVYVEKVINGNVYYTEANVDGGIGDRKISPGDGVLKSCTISDFMKLYSETLQGFIYL